MLLCYLKLRNNIEEENPGIVLTTSVLKTIMSRSKDHMIVKKILDYVGIYEFEKKRPPPKRDYP